VRASGIPATAPNTIAAASQPNVTPSAWQAAAEPYPLAYTWLRLAEAAVAAGDRQEAGRAIRQAYALASRVGATPIAEEASALARRRPFGRYKHLGSASYGGACCSSSARPRSRSRSTP
jgi:hypothetical protein